MTVLLIKFEEEKFQDQDSERTRTIMKSIGEIAVGEPYGGNISITLKNNELLISGDHKTSVIKL